MAPKHSPRSVDPQGALRRLSGIPKRVRSPPHEGSGATWLAAPCDSIRMISASVGGNTIAWVGTPLLVERHTIDQRKAPAEQAPKADLLASISVH